MKPQTYGKAGGTSSYKPQASRTTRNTGQNLNRGGFGGANGVFGSNNGRGFDRQASQRGGGSMRSAQRNGFRQKR